MARRQRKKLKFGILGTVDSHLDPYAYTTYVKVDDITPKGARAVKGRIIDVLKFRNDLGAPRFDGDLRGLIDMTRLCSEGARALGRALIAAANTADGLMFTTESALDTRDDKPSRVFLGLDSE